MNPSDFTAAQILAKLKEWAEVPHDSVCYGIVCRHVRAKKASEEVANALFEIDWQKKKCPECSGSGEIGLADGEVSCPKCGGSGSPDPKKPKQICATCGDELKMTTCDGCARRDYDGMRSMQEKFIKADAELKTALLQLSEAAEKEANRWAERLEKIPVVKDKDGSGTDTGDPLDVIEAEVRLAIDSLEEELSVRARIIEEKDRQLQEQLRLISAYKAALTKIRDYIETDYPLLSRTKEMAQEVLQQTEKRKVTPQNCGCGIDSCLLEFHRADCPLRLPVPLPLTVDNVVPDGKCWLCGRAAAGKKGAEPRCELHL